MLNEFHFMVTARERNDTQKKNNPTTRSTLNLIPEAFRSALNSITSRDEPALENCHFVAGEYFTHIFQLFILYHFRTVKVSTVLSNANYEIHSHHKLVLIFSALPVCFSVQIVLEN